MRVLVVDDDPDIRTLVRIVLRRGGWEVLEAAGGAEAAAQAGSEIPDVILLDLQLGEESGRDVFERLRGDPRCVEIPVIILSASAASADVLDLCDQGCAGVIPKPFDPLTLDTDIRRLLGLIQ